MNAVNEQEPVSPHNAVLLVDQPYVVVDACGRVEPQPSVATVSRLSQAGVALVNTRVVVLGGDGRQRPSQGQGDLRHPASRSTSNATTSRSGSK
jgi:hypothetical protein